MSRFNTSKNQKTVIVSISAVLLLALVCFVGCLLSNNHWVNNSNANNSNPGAFYIEETGRTYQYELKMFGVLPNTTEPISFYVYTDDANLSFSEVSLALISSQHTNFDFYISEDPIEKID